MAKCLARSPRGFKCNRLLVECLRDGMHVGRRFLRKGGSRFENDAWHWDITSVVLLPAWQPQVKSEVRRLGYEAKYAAEDKDPKRYQRFKEQRRFVAGFVVSEVKHRSGVTVRIRRGDATPIVQRRLEV